VPSTRVSYWSRLSNRIVPGHSNVVSCGEFNQWMGTSTHPGFSNVRVLYRSSSTKKYRSNRGVSGGGCSYFYISLYVEVHLAESMYRFRSGAQWMEYVLVMGSSAYWAVIECVAYGERSIYFYRVSTKQEESGMYSPMWYELVKIGHVVVKTTWLVFIECLVGGSRLLTIHFSEWVPGESVRRSVISRMWKSISRYSSSKSFTYCTNTVDNPSV
jgi:hypothetical protein